MKTNFQRFLTKLVLVLTILVFTGTSKDCAGIRAQTTPIGFTSAGLIGMPDTVYSGDSVLVGAYIKNYDTTGFIAFNDTIQIKGYVDTTGSSVDTFYLPPVPPQSVIGSGDSIFFILPIGFRDVHMNGKFRIGNNVIVVWPILYDPSFSTFDSLTANVFVIDTISGIGADYSNQGAIRCYPVPASGPLYVTSTNRLLVIKEITIRDAAGKLIAISNNPESGILTDTWASGVYLLEIEFVNGQRSTYKIVR